MLCAVRTKKNITCDTYVFENNNRFVAPKGRKRLDRKKKQNNTVVFPVWLENNIAALSYANATMDFIDI